MHSHPKDEETETQDSYLLKQILLTELGFEPKSHWLQSLGSYSTPDGEKWLNVLGWAKGSGFSGKGWELRARPGTRSFSGRLPRAAGHKRLDSAERVQGVHRPLCTSILWGVFPHLPTQLLSRGCRQKGDLLDGHRTVVGSLGWIIKATRVLFQTIPASHRGPSFHPLTWNLILTFCWFPSNPCLIHVFNTYFNNVKCARHYSKHFIHTDSLNLHNNSSK